MTEAWGYTIKIIAGFEPHMIRTHLLEQGKKTGRKNRTAVNEYWKNRRGQSTVTEEHYRHWLGSSKQKLLLHMWCFLVRLRQKVSFWIYEDLGTLSHGN